MAPSIDSLLLVAGCAAAGKSTVIRGLRSGAIKAPPSFPDLRDWKVRKVNQVVGDDKKARGRLILHFNLGVEKGDMSRAERLLPQLLEAAGEVRCLTLVAPLPAILQRLEERGPEAANQRRLTWFSNHPEAVLRQYDLWLDLLSRIRVLDHWFVDTGKSSARFVGLTEWRVEMEEAWRREYCAEG